MARKVMGRHFKACFAHWPDLKNLLQLFANSHLQSVHKAPGATINDKLTYISQTPTLYDPVG